MRRPAVAAVVASAVVAICIIGASVSVALRDLPPLDRALEAHGFDVGRATGTPASSLRWEATTPDLIVVAGRSPAFTSEMRALRGYVEAGGNVLIISTDPAPWLPSSLGQGLHVSRGALYSSTGEAPTVQLADGRATGRAPALFALEDRSGAFSAVLRTASDAFRDSNGNAILDEGEPGGPFLVAALASHGAGRYIVVAADEPALLPEAFFGAAIDGLGDGDHALVVNDAVGGTWVRWWSSVGVVAALPAANAFAAALPVAVAALGAALVAAGDTTTGRREGISPALAAFVEFLRQEPSNAAEALVKLVDSERGR